MIIFTHFTKRINIWLINMVGGIEKRKCYSCNRKCCGKKKCRGSQRHKISDDKDVEEPFLIYKLYDNTYCCSDESLLIYQDGSIYWKERCEYESFARAIMN